jgi:histidinol dehydrogenase
MIDIADITQALAFCDKYRQAPQKSLQDYQVSKKFSHLNLYRSQTELQSISNSLDPITREAIDGLIESIDEKNSTLAQQAYEASYYSKDLYLSWSPLSSAGIYVPYKLASSLITWLSAAKAAGVEQLTVYLAQDPDSGKPCPASVYAALQYGVDILVGPARFAFPCLAFGDGDNFAGTDIICGPAGKRLNLLKQIAALLAVKITDFYAGPSELAVAIDSEIYLAQALKDLAAQIEHGEDSAGHLILVGLDRSVLANHMTTLPSQLDCHEAADWNQACLLIDKLAVETAELLGEINTINNALHSLKHCGVAYTNLSSSMGDYLIVGRGCGDPTQGSARSSSGISPLLFMRLRTLIQSYQPDPKQIQFGCKLAEYEQLTRHLDAIRSCHEIFRI